LSRKLRCKIIRNKLINKNNCCRNVIKLSLFLIYLKNMSDKTQIIMKKIFIIFTFLFPLLLASQSSNYSDYLTPGGLMDTVFDRFGKKHVVKDLQIKSNGKQIGSGAQVSSIVTCTAGMFVVYYANGSGMESTTNPVHATRRQTVCEVLSNISGLLGYNSSYPSSALVKILVDDISPYTSPFSPSTSGVGGLASAFYVIPWNPSSPYPGISENIIEKTIKSRVNGWNNIISPVLPIAGNGFYHGILAINFSNPSFNWNSGISATASSSQFDLYSVVLHEITHALGFASLISANGNSKFGVANNYYSTYDKFLNAVGNNNTLIPLLTTTNTCSQQYGLTFTSTPSLLAPSCNPTYSTDITSCSTAIKYNSPVNNNISVYTPACYENGSSLSHFEDMCYPINSPTNNNQYFVMSNSGGLGLNKRFLKPEEKNVLCDLGYTVSNTYTSLAASANFTYSGMTCSNSPVWGVNDGLNGNAFLFSSTGGPITIPIVGTNGIIANDYQGSNPVTTISCVESVYNNGTAAVTGTDIVFTPNNSNGGIFLIRYIPKNSSGSEGNITYIFGFVYPSYCGSVTPCDMVQNGSFENNSGCGSMPLGSTTLASCWLVTSLSPDLFLRGCTTGTMPSNLGTNTYSSIPVFDSFNGAPNNAVMGIGASSANNILVYSESLTNYLGAPILNNQVYTLSFWAYQFAGTKFDPQFFLSGNYPNQIFNTFSVSAVLSFAIDSFYNPASFGTNSYPYSPLTTIKSVTLSNNFNVWNHYSITFTTTAINSGNWLYVGMDKNLTFNNIVNTIGNSNPNGLNFYTLLDDISLRPANQALQMNMPSQICLGQSLIDLGQYVNIGGGVFSGAGVTSSVVSTPNGTLTQYNFNLAQTMNNGIYSITYTFTDNISCSQTSIHQIKIGNNFDGVKIAYASTTNCVNAGTLSVLSPTSAYNFTWQPGNFVGNNYVIASNNIVNYSVIGSNGNTCTISGSITVAPITPTAQLNVSPQFACPGSSIQISALGSYTSIFWQPGNYTTSIINVSPLSPTNYSAYLTSNFGCSVLVTTLVLTSVAPTVNIAMSNSLVCIGHSSTLTANGASNYYWSNNVTGSVNVVSPSSTTVYSVTGTGTNNCSSNTTAMVTFFIPNITIYGSSVICVGEKVILSSQSFANTYAWQPANTAGPSPSISVSPLVSTIYTLHTTSLTLGNSCLGTNTLQIIVNQCSAIKDKITSLNRFIIYPNPTEGIFTIESKQESDLELNIYNETGQLLKSLNIYSQEKRNIDLSDFAEGLYFVEANLQHSKLVILKK